MCLVFVALGLAQVVKGWEGFVGGPRFKSEWGQKFIYKKAKKKSLFLSNLGLKSFNMV